MTGSAVPKYWPLRSWLDDFARTSEPGTPVPSERALAERFGLSRTSVRQAIRDLIVEGRLRSVQGSGTFVAAPKVRYRMRLTSYTDEMAAQGIAVTGSLLEIREQPADALAAPLGLAAGDPVVRVVRLRRADGVPMAIEESVLPAALVPGLERKMDAGASLTDVLEREYGIVVATAQESVEAALADPASAGLLAIDAGLPVLVLTRHAFLLDGSPVEWARSTFRGDRAVVVADLVRGTPEP